MGNFRFRVLWRVDIIYVGWLRYIFNWYLSVWGFGVVGVFWGFSGFAEYFD